MSSPDDGASVGYIPEFTLEAKEYAVGSISAEEQAILEAADRVRTGVVAKATVFMLGESLDLSPGTRDELGEKLAAIVKGDQEDRLEINVLLGSLTKIVDGVAANGSADILQTGLVKEGNLALPQVVVDREISTELSTPPQSQEKNKDQITPRERMNKFLTDVFSDELKDGEELDIDEHISRAVVAELILMYSDFKGKALNAERKAEQIERLKAWLGTNEEPMSNKEIANKFGLSNPVSVSQGRNKVIELLKRKLTPEQYQTVWAKVKTSRK